MKQTSKTIYGEQSNIMLDTSEYDTLPLKIKKLDVKDLLDVNEVLKAGILLTKDGKKVTTTSTTTDAHCILKNDLDFKGSMSPDSNPDNACEVGSVLIRGNVIESAIKLNVTNKEIEKVALKHIYFGE
ncbi:hypothetical protein psyc5s11_30130 [Clostridium gelidum]|uniref:Uncharacterized protein n=1 Tax=Clostridium gelidum TaxID=704125 RepID=A0ABN6IZ65_9CLOT|nr:hypothetical protein [Clostridium gelidum]BCZ46946.1 hypothetical protein psyc5s11_30130 [Clostridium gelidum]